MCHEGWEVALFAALVAHFVDFSVATGSRLLSHACLPAACQCHVRHFIVILMQGSSFTASAIDYAKLLAGQRVRMGGKAAEKPLMDACVKH